MATENHKFCDAYGPGQVFPYSNMLMFSRYYIYVFTAIHYINLSHVSRCHVALKKAQMKVTNDLLLTADAEDCCLKKYGV